MLGHINERALKEQLEVSYRQVKPAHQPGEAQ
jgi:hypothetical protein